MLEFRTVAVSTKKPATFKPENLDSMRLFAQAEVYVEDHELPDGRKERLVRLRFRTKDLGKGGKSSPGTTPWVYMNASMLDQFSSQLATIAAVAKTWQSGPDVSALGVHPGITMRVEKPE